MISSNDNKNHIFPPFAIKSVMNHWVQVLMSFFKEFHNLSQKVPVLIPFFLHFLSSNRTYRFSLCDGYKARLVLANQHRLYVADRKSLIGLTQLNELARIICENVCGFATFLPRQ